MVLIGQASLYTDEYVCMYTWGINFVRGRGTREKAIHLTGLGGYEVIAS